jgi:MFS family permease
MQLPQPSIPSAPDAPDRLSRNVPMLGLVSLLMGMSSAMIYGILPVFLVVVLGASTASVGLIEGIAEATTSFVKIFSGFISDRIGRRKPLVVLGYAFSAVNKLLFPVAESASMVLLARVSDRIGKGIRDAPRDAFMTDLTPSAIRGTGFGLRAALYTIGAVLGPVVLLLWVKETPDSHAAGRWLPIRLDDFRSLPGAFWWAISIAAMLSLARFSPAFLVLKAHSIHVDAAFVPIILVAMYLVFSAAAYPFGVLADHIDRHIQLGMGMVVLISADLALASADTLWMTMLGGGLWGLQMGMTQGLLSAAVADAAPERLRGTAFGIFDMVIGLATFTASAGAGALWMLGGAALTCSVGATLGAGALVMLLLRRALPANKFGY